MNRVVHTLGNEGAWLIGVIETPCYPCSYYGGYYKIIRGEPTPTDNRTGNYFRTIPEAVKWASTFFPTREQQKQNMEDNLTSLGMNG
jgi:hypothetical protein